jgi:transposase
MRQTKMSTFERLGSGKMSRRERKELAHQMAAADPELEMVHRNAAGIDIGNQSHFVAVPPGRDAEPVREFGCWTQDLQRMAEWLKGCGIRTVAMQSTGVYWMAVYEVLEQAGLEVFLVNARGTKNLPGRKSDVQECQWLMKLHTYGLLRNSFRPPEEIRAVRTIWRLRERLVQDAGRSVQQMQKALTKMNVQLANAISDVTGTTGLAIIRAIVAGERDPWKLAKFRDRRIRASEEEIAHSLEGRWQPDVLFELEQVVEAYDFHQKQIQACDEKLRQYMAVLPLREIAPSAEPGVVRVEDPQAARRRKEKQRRKSKNQPDSFDLKEELRRTAGVDLTSIDGFNVMTAQTIVSELGPDLSRFPTEAHFSSWLTLAPRRDISGGRVIRHKPSPSQNRVANALRMAAEALSRSESYLGAKYRSLRARLGGLKAVKAMARYLACIVYRLLTQGQTWVDRGTAHFESKRQQRELSTLHRRAAAIGMLLVPA